MPLSHSPCPAEGCYRGAIGAWNWQFKDGPCDAADCQWPKDVQTRQHFSDNPSRIVYKGHGQWVFEW
jgi:hypothetical protein